MSAVWRSATLWKPVSNSGRLMNLPYNLGPRYVVDRIHFNHQLRSDLSDPLQTNSNSRWPESASEPLKAHWPLGITGASLVLVYLYLVHVRRSEDE
jgi:hypothetical protein